MTDRIHTLFGQLFQAHPWHGVDPGPDARGALLAYLEFLPSDTVKVELDKATGILRVDRPQRYSSLCPMPYGFVPQTFCAERIAARCMAVTGATGTRGDGDPLDICVLTERSLPRSDLLVRCIPIGGLRMVDHDEADDKIVAVLEDDAAFGHLRDLAECPQGLVDRLRHYFLSYKQIPGDGSRQVEIAEVYGAEEARAVILASQQDYVAHYGEPEARWDALRSWLKA
jgi:inorganic pyrophosphatase